MRVTRLHVDRPLSVGASVALPAETVGHLLRVLRAGVGDACILFNGDGHDYEARITAANKRGAEVEIVAARALDNESPLRITLLQALARGDKMDWILQKATELGVAAILPVTSQYSEVRLDEQRAVKRLAHWQAVVAAACGQAGRATVPMVSTPSALASAMESIPQPSLRLLLDPRASRGIDSPGQSIHDADQSDVVLAVGPEGGWSTHDLATLAAAGFQGLRLGPRVLRTETAGLAAIAALQLRFGDLA